MDGAHIPSSARLFPGSISSSADLLKEWRQLQDVAGSLNVTDPPDIFTANVVVPLSGVEARAGSGTVHLNLDATGVGEAPVAPGAPPEVLVGVALVDPGARTDEGQLILAVTPAWRRILSDLERDPNALYRLNPRQGEELVAGAYREDGWRVTLTPRSGDGGVDIIAVREDVGAIRVLDQVKLYAATRLVPADDVRALWGVLNRDRRASKAVLTTTSGFAPGVYREFADSVPTRLDLRDGVQLRDWLKRIYILGQRKGGS